MPPSNPRNIDCLATCPWLEPSSSPLPRSVQHSDRRTASTCREPFAVDSEGRPGPPWEWELRGGQHIFLCGRSDGRGWFCSSLAIPGDIYCAKHARRPKPLSPARLASLKRQMLHRRALRVRISGVIDPDLPQDAPSGAESAGDAVRGGGRASSDGWCRLAVSEYNCRVLGFEWDTKDHPAATIAPLGSRGSSQVGAPRSSLALAAPARRMRDRAPGFAARWPSQHMPNAITPPALVTHWPALRAQEVFRDAADADLQGVPGRAIAASALWSGGGSSQGGAVKGRKEIEVARGAEPEKKKEMKPRTGVKKENKTREREGGGTRGPDGGACTDQRPAGSDLGSSRGEEEASAREHVPRRDVRFGMLRELRALGIWEPMMHKRGSGNRRGPASGGSEGREGREQEGRGEEGRGEEGREEEEREEEGREEGREGRGAYGDGTELGVEWRDGARREKRREKGKRRKRVGERRRGRRREIETEGTRREGADAVKGGVASEGRVQGEGAIDGAESDAPEGATTGPRGLGEGG